MVMILQIVIKTIRTKFKEVETVANREFQNLFTLEGSVYTVIYVLNIPKRKELTNRFALPLSSLHPHKKKGGNVSSSISLSLLSLLGVREVDGSHIFFSTVALELIG